MQSFCEFNDKAATLVPQIVQKKFVVTRNSQKGLVTPIGATGSCQQAAARDEAAW